jgi:hypothetical protein
MSSIVTCLIEISAAVAEAKSSCIRLAVPRTFTQLPNLDKSTKYIPHLHEQTITLIRRQSGRAIRRAWQSMCSARRLGNLVFAERVEIDMHDDVHSNIRPAACGASGRRKSG